MPPFGGPGKKKDEKVNFMLNMLNILTLITLCLYRRKRRNGNHRPVQQESARSAVKVLIRQTSCLQVYYVNAIYYNITLSVFPTTRCKLKLLRAERIKDYLLLEEEFVQNQERLKPREEKHQEERNRVDDLRGQPMNVGTLEEIIDDDHAIVSSTSGPEYYVSIMSFVDKDSLEPGCSILLHHKV